MNPAGGSIVCSPLARALSTFTVLRCRCATTVVRLTTFPKSRPTTDTTGESDECRTESHDCACEGSVGCGSRCRWGAWFAGGGSVRTVCRAEVGQRGEPGLHGLRG